MTNWKNDFVKSITAKTLIKMSSSYEQEPEPDVAFKSQFCLPRLHHDTALATLLTLSVLRKIKWGFQ